MSQSVYTQSLIGSILLCAVSGLSLFNWQNRSSSSEMAGKDAARMKEFRSFQRSFLIVTLLAMFSDWVQGPYGYALYASYGYTQGQIAILYMGGFLSSMVAGSYVGAVADNFGRRKMCVVYALTYGISGICKAFNDYYILMFGRFFAGVATSLLFSSFEAWMVCEHHKRGFDNALLSETFSYLTLGNGLAAVLAGLVANAVAHHYGYIGPFIFSLLPLTLVAVLSLLLWNENYGDSNSRPELAISKAWSYIRSNASVMCLGMGQSCFEGAMYAFVFVWTPALEAGDPGVGPFLGVVFSTFMVCSMTGSNLFTLLVRQDMLSTIPLIVHSIATVATFISCVSANAAATVYASFLAFELTVGLFYPSYGTIKSMHIPEEVRSGVMNIFRVPLNAIMVVLLGLIEVKKISNSTTLALCTCIHGLGLMFYIGFSRLQKNAAGAGYSPVNTHDSSGVSDEDSEL